ncbi:MAG TPA: helical backbone metal receptor, partial [Puia sp.]|nr:helical backbone metal receptor [Puia sp.]
MPSFTDHLGRTIFLPRVPRRIVSLVPSQTELLYSLGLDEAVAGITKFCIHPEAWFHTKPRIGGTKAIDAARVDALHPDLIIANKEENEKPQIEALANRYPVWISDVKNLEDALAMIRAVGSLTDTAGRATAIAGEIAREFAGLSDERSVAAGRGDDRDDAFPPAAYFIWKDPWMVAGKDTFIDDMLRHCGFRNIYADTERYPSVQLSDLAALARPVILLSSEPYPFRQRHVKEVSEVLPHATILLVDGEL